MLPNVDDFRQKFEEDKDEEVHSMPDQAPLPMKNVNINRPSLLKKLVAVVKRDTFKVITNTKYKCSDEASIDPQAENNQNDHNNELDSKE